MGRHERPPARSLRGARTPRSLLGMPRNTLQCTFSYRSASHEPLPNCQTPDVLGRPVPEERRERRQAALFDLASALGRHGEEGGDLRDPRLRPSGAVCRGTWRSSAISIVLPA